MYVRFPLASPLLRLVPSASHRRDAMIEHRRSLNASIEKEGLAVYWHLNLEQMKYSRHEIHYRLFDIVIMMPGGYKDSLLMNLKSFFIVAEFWFIIMSAASCPIFVKSVVITDIP